jgi:hypothetical protein
MYIGVKMATDLNTLLRIPALSLHVFEARYGNGFIAFVSKDYYAEKIIDLHTEGDNEYDEVLNSLFYSSWYPKASGNTPMDAIKALESFLQTSEFAKSKVDTEHALNMLLGRITDNKSWIISTKNPLILREHSEGPYSNEWVNDLVDILDEIRK